MYGLFRRLFAPRWQHPDPEVRRKALIALDPKQAAQRDALTILASDQDSNIQLAALLALDDIQGLLAGYQRHPNDRAWLEAIRLRLTGVTGNFSLQQRQAITAELSDPALLSAITLEGDNLDLRLTALAKLSTDTDLIYQACRNGVAAVRQQAAQRIEDEESLKRLLKEARRDRQVTRIARDKLAQLRHDTQWLEEQKTQREGLLRQLEQHANAPWEPLYGGRLRHLEREWNSLAIAATDTQEQRFHDAVLGSQKTLHAHEAQEQARQQSAEQRAEIESARDTLLAGFETTLTELSQDAPINAHKMEHLASQHQLISAQWQHLSSQLAANKQHQHRYTQAQGRYESYAAAWQRWITYEVALNAAVANQDYATVSGLIKLCDWPTELPQPESLQHASGSTSPPSETEATLEQAEPDLKRQPPSFEALDQQLQQLEQLLEQGAFNHASRAHQQLTASFEDLGAHQARPQRAILKRLGAKLAELRDWRGFAASPKREELCLNIEALADDQEMAKPALDRHHRQLVKEWKALSDAAANREQSARFRAASDRIHAHLAPWREQLGEEREENLRQRDALCEQLEALLNQPATSADPDALREIRDKARQQWRIFSPVPRDKAIEVTQRFDNIRQRLQTLIDHRAEQVGQQKRLLIEHAQALLSSSEPLDQRIAQTKQLQQQWRQLGRAPKGQEHVLWKAFRQVCDQLFAQRDAQKDAQHAHQQQQLDSMQALIDGLDSWQPNHTDDSAALDDYLAQIAQLEPLPRGKRNDGMQRRLKGIIRVKQEQLSQLHLADMAQQWQSVQQLIKAHLAADQQRLAGNKVSPVDQPHGLPKVFATAHRQRNHLRQSCQLPLPTTQLEQLGEQLNRLRVYLTLLVEGTVAPHDEPLRLTIQVERLNEGLGADRRPIDEVYDVLSSLLALGPLPESLWDKGRSDWERLLSRLAKSPPVH